MKQNERLLVYAVTGFLALILVIAVVCGSDPIDAGAKQEAGTQNGRARDLDALLGGGPRGAEGDGGEAVTNRSGLPSPEQSIPEQPLRTSAPVASVLVEQAYGQSRLEHGFRWVTVRPNDSWESLARRWCGTSPGYVDEIRHLNEDTLRLIAGDELMVPLVEDEVLAERIKAEQAAAQPRTLVTDSSSNGSSSNGARIEGGGGAQPAFNQGPSPSIAEPSYAMPGRGRQPVDTNGGAGNASASNTAAGNAAGNVGATETYTVVAGDSLWRIAARRYGNGQATAMIEQIKRMNPGLTDRLDIGKVLRVPAR